MTSDKKNQPTSPNNKTVLRHLREKAGLTREELVARMQNKVSVTTVSRWENRPQEPSMTREEWSLFCDAIGIPFNKLPKQLSDWVDEEVMQS